MFENIEKFPDWQKILILLGIIIVIPALLYTFLISPQSAEIEQLEIQIAELSEKVYKLKDANQRLKQLEEEIQELDIEYKKLCEKLPESKDIYALLQNVYQLAVGNKIDILEFRRGSAITQDEKQLYYKIPIKMNIKGGYHALAQFFEQVGNLDRIVNMETLTITAMTPFREGISVKADFGLYTYTLKTRQEQQLQTSAKGKKSGQKKK